MKVYKNRKIFLSIILVVSVIMFLFIKPRQDTTESSAPLLKVVTIQSQAQSTMQDLGVHGHTQAARSVTLRAEIAGRIEKVLAKKGKTVSLNEELITLSSEDRPVRLAEAKALVKQREKELASGNKLKAQAFRAENALVAQEALLATANTLLAKVEKEIQNTHITAPFAGIVDQQFLEIGDFVASGEKIATVVELDPLLVLCHIAEKDIAQLQENANIKIYLPNFKRTVEGKIHYISRTADPKTRTFSVEVIIANQDYTIPDGATAEVILSKGEAQGHKIAPSNISLNDEGVLGVKVVESGKVSFIPIQLLNTVHDGVWVTGLPEKAQIITVGADFVAVGQEVKTQQVEAKP
ncbi:MAG: efflux RND transporter periplasmic adaptor subunit [Alphaproteobacteria bacterium]